VEATKALCLAEIAAIFTHKPARESGALEVPRYKITANKKPYNPTESTRHNLPHAPVSVKHRFPTVTYKSFPPLYILSLPL
jgi:hypothetical protein